MWFSYVCHDIVKCITVRNHDTDYQGQALNYLSHLILCVIIHRISHTWGWWWWALCVYTFKTNAAEIRQKLRIAYLVVWNHSLDYRFRFDHWWISVLHTNVAFFISYHCNQYTERNHFEVPEKIHANLIFSVFVLLAKSRWTCLYSKREMSTLLQNRVVD